MGKAQITLFFILAIIIVIAGSVYFYYQSLIVDEGETVEPDLVPVKSFIEACIDQTASQGISLLGLNGGYIYFPLIIETNPRSYLQEGPLDEVKNPYWRYQGRESIPTEEYMVSQIERYTAENLRNCINSFQDFGNSFQVEELSPINPKVTLNDDKVIIEIEYLIDILRRNNKTRTRFDKFSVTLPVRLKKTYELAKEVMAAENRDNFIERKAIDLIVLDPDIPTTDYEATCRQKRWSFSAVQNKFKRLLAVNLPYIKVVGTEFSESTYVPNPFGGDTYSDSYYSSKYRWQVSDNKYPGLAASFSYDESWPMLFETRPRNGDVMRSNARGSQDILSFFCFNIWHFTYDAQFPVKVSIAETSQAYRPFVFRFALMTAIDHNYPKRDIITSDVFEVPERPTGEEFCNDIGSQIAIYTLSNTTFGEEDIAGADLFYTCGSYTCPLGQSEWLSLGAAAGLVKKLPSCTLGVLRAKKPGYEESQQFISSDEPGAFSIYLKPLKEFTRVKAVKNPLGGGPEKELAGREQATISIKRRGSDEQFVTYPAEGISVQLLEDNADYDVSIYLFDGDTLLGAYKGAWHVSQQQVKDASEIIFHVVEQGLASDEDSALFIAGLESYSQQVPQPELR
ncbi:hypothetical protein J4212_01375 [Candidatus Woesearchaeota archaeon]|nr:hypothetical protein [Candidatus Woesearchaeota archaeon]